MLGPPVNSIEPSKNAEHGLIYRCMNELFTSLKIKDKENQQLSLIKVSFIEIYQDKMRDLLISRRVNANSEQIKKTAFGKAVLNNENKEFEANNRLKIKMRYKDKHPSESYVSNLTEEYVTSMKDIEIFVGIAKARRATCATLANAYSSRSHWVMIVTIEQKTHDSCTTISKLNFVDLAGSEKIKISQVTGNSLQEAKNINKSLHNLRLCISALANKQAHIPYRDSKLTHLLQDSLGGNTKTSLLITLNIDKNMSDETISSCRFGCEAQNVVNIAKINKRASRKQLENLIAKLQKELYKKLHSKHESSTCVESDASVPSYNAQLYNAQRRIKELEKSIENYEEMLSKINGRQVKGKQDMDNLSKLFDELKNERQIMENSVQNLSEELEKTRRNNLQLKDKNYSLKKDNDELNKQVMSANNHIYDLQSTINRNDRFYVEVTNQNADLSQKFEELQKAQHTKFELLLNQISMIHRHKGPDIINRERNIINEDEDSKRQEIAIIDNRRLVIEENVVEFSIAPQPVICSTQLIQAYFTNIEDESGINNMDDELNQEGIPMNNKRRKITPKPIRLLIKILRLISPKYKTTGSFDDYSRNNITRHRTFSDDMINMNQGYKSYTTPGPGYFGAGNQAF